MQPSCVEDGSCPWLAAVSHPKRVEGLLIWVPVDVIDDELLLAIDTLRSCWNVAIIFVFRRGAIQQHSRTIRLPSHVHDRARRFRQTRERLSTELGCTPTPRELADELEIDEKQVEMLTRIDQRPASLDAPVHSAEEASLGDLLEDPRNLDPVEELHQVRLIREVESLLLGLSPRERDVLSWKFGLVGDRGLTLQEIADRLGLSRERVRQIQVAAELKQLFPDLLIVGSAYTYLQEWLPNVAQYNVRTGRVDFVGIGRLMLSYPDFPADVLSGRPLKRKRICRTFSDCTTAPRMGLVSGCYPLDEFYKRMPEARALADAKRQRDTDGGKR